MNKLFSALLLSAGLVVATSCSDDVQVPVSQDAEMTTLSVKIPGELGTRAFGDGTQALNLYYAIYTQGENPTLIYSNFASATDEQRTPAVTFTNTDGTLTATVSVKLAINETYDTYFWAESYTDGAAECPFTFAPDAKTLTVDYAKMDVNNETPDAFYAYKAMTVSATGNQSVVLYRPFAQVNWGTADYDEAMKLGMDEITNTTSYLYSVPNVLNMTDGSTSGSKFVYGSAYAPIPGDDEVFPVEGEYKYLAMAYVLAPKAESQLVTATLRKNNTSTAVRSIQNVPIRANYRTNLYGNLLTKDQDINVTIDPIFDSAFQNPIDLPKWTGEVDTEIPVATETIDGKNVNVYSVSTPEQLAGFAESVKNGNKYAGAVVRLEADINLNGVNWDAVNNFSGTFDGNGHTIYNLSVDHTGNSAGMFGSCVSAKFNNITIDGASVTSTGKWNGVLLGYSYSSITNCVVKNAVLNIPNEGGIICGFQAKDSGGFITDCKAINCVINAGSTWDVGQIAGSVRKGAVVNCTAENVTGVTKLVGREL